MNDSNAELLPIEGSLDSAVTEYGKRTATFIFVAVISFLIFIVLPLSVMKYPKETMMFLLAGGVFVAVVYMLPFIRDLATEITLTVSGMAMKLVRVGVLKSMRLVFRMLDLDE